MYNVNNCWEILCEVIKTRMIYLFISIPMHFCKSVISFLFWEITETIKLIFAIPKTDTRILSSACIAFAGHYTWCIIQQMPSFGVPLWRLAVKEIHFELAFVAISIPEISFAQIPRILSLAICALILNVYSWFDMVF